MLLLPLEIGSHTLFVHHQKVFVTAVVVAFKRRMVDADDLNRPLAYQGLLGILLDNAHMERTDPIVRVLFNLQNLQKNRHLGRYRHNLKVVNADAATVINVAGRHAHTHFFGFPLYELDIPHS